MPKPQDDDELSARDRLALVEQKQQQLRDAKREAIKPFDDELDTLDQERGPLEAEIRREEASALSEAVPYLLKLVPEHSRRSCDDDNAANYDRGCTRCQLLQIRESEFLAGDYRVSLSLHDVTAD